MTHQLHHKPSRAYRGLFHELSVTPVPPKSCWVTIDRPIPWQSWKVAFGLLLLFVVILVPVIIHLTMTTDSACERQAHRDCDIPAVDSQVDARPNIVFVLADDLGFYDVGYQGSRMRTPNIDRLASEGVKLENYYVQPVCTPTRSQFMSGRYQIHTGLQHEIIRPTRPSGLPLTSRTIAWVLKESGYSTHIVGKWHLGFYRPEYMPTNRGFDTFYGFLTGASDYFKHTRRGYLDLRHNMTPVWNEKGHYSTHLFTEKACNIIQSHDSQKGPLFLFMSHQTPHGPLQVPESYMEQFQDIRDQKRRTYAGMVSTLDESIGNMTAALKGKGLWDNTVFVFSSDNGGSPHRGGFNYPLRGSKGSLWEGGIRSPCFVHSPLLNNSGSVVKGLIHVSDWFPTFVRLANASLEGTLPLDGFDQWTTISKNAPSPRIELLHNIDNLKKRSGKRLFNDTFDTRIHAAIRVGDFKLITGNPGKGSWYGAPELDLPDTLPPQDEDASKNVWLFNITEDPEERHDLSGFRPEVVRNLLDRLLVYSSTAVEPWFPDLDPEGIPTSGGVWGPWMGADVMN